MRRALVVVACLSTLAGSMLAGAAANAQTTAPLDAGRLATMRDSLFRFQTTVGNLESALVVNRNDISNMVAQVRYFPIERRLLDADLFFEMKDYEKAATLFRDLVDNPAFRDQPGYYKALYKLGESLYRLRNLQSARHYLKMVATPAAGPDFSAALARLFEIAVQTHDFTDCDKWEALVAQGSSPEAAYAFGKYLHSRGRKADAQQAFARVPAGSPPFARAQYFLGVIEAENSRMEPALSFFTNAAGVAPTAGSDTDVQGMSILARARILHELARFPDALMALQQVDARSSAFLDSLYDTAWIYLRMTELEKAAHALDILLMSSPPGEMALRANALRGRILTRLNDPDGATEAYQDVSNTLGPVTAELDKISSEPGALGAYFQWVMDRNAASLKLEVPISEKTAKWLESDRDMGSIVGMFKDVARERDDVRESMEVVEKLLWALDSGGKLEAFPALKDKYLHLKEAESKFVEVGVAAADLLVEATSARLTGDAKTAYDGAVKARKQAVAAQANAPKTYQDFIGREKKTTEEYKELEKMLFQVESLLRILRQQVLAVEEWLREQKFRESGVPMTPEREVAVRAEIDAVKAQLVSFNAEASRIRDAMERDTLTNASVAAAMAEESALRHGLEKALLAEAEALRAGSTMLDAGLAELAGGAATLVGRAVAGGASVEPVSRGLMDVADKGAAEFKDTVLREKSRLESEIGELQKAEMDSRAFAQSEGAQVFRGVKDRLGEVLLEADLGLVDMAWQREQAIGDKLKLLGSERAEKMKGVAQMEAILKTTGGKAGETPAEGGGK